MAQNSPEDENLPIFSPRLSVSYKPPPPKQGQGFGQVMCQAEMPAAMKAAPAKQNGIPHKKKREDTCHGVNLVEKIKGIHL